MSGNYATLDLPWYETRILNCSFCGKMIAVQYWREDSYPADKFCEPACADLKRRLALSLSAQQDPSHDRRRS